MFSSPGMSSIRWGLAPTPVGMGEVMGAADGINRQNLMRWLRERASAAQLRWPGMWLAEDVNWNDAARKNRQRVRCARVLWRDVPDKIAATTCELSDRK